MKRFVVLFLFAFSALFSQSNYESGERNFNNKKPKEAEQNSISSHVSNSNDIKAIELLGDKAVDKKDWASAKVYFKKLIRLSPNTANFHYKYGGALGMYAKSCNKFKALTMLDDIEGSFLKAIALDSKHIGARKALVSYYLEVPGIVGGSVSKAKTYAKELSQLSPKEGVWANAQIEAYLN